MTKFDQIWFVANLVHVWDEVLANRKYLMLLKEGLQEFYMQPSSMVHFLQCEGGFLFFVLFTAQLSNSWYMH